MDPNIIQFELNGFDACREMAPDIALSDEQSDNVSTSVLYSDHHGAPLLTMAKVPLIKWQSSPPTLRRQGVAAAGESGRRNRSHLSDFAKNRGPRLARSTSDAASRLPAALPL